MSRELWILIAIVALAGSLVLAALAQSLRDCSRTLLEEIATIRKRRGAQDRADKILSDVEGHATSLGFPRIICNLMFVIALVNWIREYRGALVSTWIEVSIAVVAASFILWIFGTLIPSAIARHAAEQTVYAWSAVIRFAYMMAAPFRPLQRGIDEIIRRLSGKTREDSAQEIEQELLSVVEDATEEGKFDDTERDMIEAVVKFRDRTVAQVMTPRTEMEAMPLVNDLSKVTQTIRSIGHSRIPVYEGDLDHIVGVFYVKDLMKWLAGDAPISQQATQQASQSPSHHANSVAAPSPVSATTGGPSGGSRGGRTFDLRALLRPATFVPETKTIRELLPELLAKRTHIALVADEYGGTAGLITIEDIVEEVFGDIQDEYEHGDETAPEVKIDADTRTAEIDARASIEDANYELLRALGATLPDSDEYETVGGFVTVSMGRIPEPGETLQFEGGTILVLAAEPTRVTKVQAIFQGGPASNGTRATLPEHVSAK
jgi:CBS domain containing-hemolysin-like protein